MKYNINQCRGNSLGVSFNNRPAEIVAPDLLGKYLIRFVDGVLLVGKIIEVEAYLGSGDLAAHNSRGKTKSNNSLFTKPGTTYVHRMRQYCLIDIVTKVPSSVLIRGIEPIQGVEYMKTQRGKDNIKGLVDGPGKLCKAFNINHNDDGISIVDNDSGIIICDFDKITIGSIVSDDRIGISQEKNLPLRFCLL